MKTVLLVVLALFVLYLGLNLWWRFASRRQALPCPSWLAWSLENPYTRFIAGSALLLDRLDLHPGMRVLDAGSGPGRLTIPAAQRVGPDDQVVALDLQPGMLQRLEQRAAAEELTNIRTILGGVGEGLLGREAFDRALLVTVLGEIVDRAKALREIHTSLKPGGVLSVTEMFGDPHYQGRTTVRRLAEAAGFRLDRQFGTWLAFTLNFVKPFSDGPADGQPEPPPRA